MLLQASPEEAVGISDDEIGRSSPKGSSPAPRSPREIDLEPFKDWLDALNAVGRGSDAHMFLTVKYRERARLAAAAALGTEPGGQTNGGGYLGTGLERRSGKPFASEAVRAADLACASAHIARYGHVEDVVREGARGAAGSKALLWDLVQIRSRLAAGATMATRISIMAWDIDRCREGKKEAQE